MLNPDPDFNPTTLTLIACVYAAQAGMLSSVVKIDTTMTPMWKAFMEARARFGVTTPYDTRQALEPVAAWNTVITAAHALKVLFPHGPVLFPGNPAFGGALLSALKVPRPQFIYYVGGSTHRTSTAGG